jgi:hypothetical protein
MSARARLLVSACVLVPGAAVWIALPDDAGKKGASPAGQAVVRSSSHPMRERQEVRSGRIVGDVRDPDGKPVAGALVALFDGTAGEGPVALRRPRAQFTSSVQGEFRFEDLAAGRYALSANAPEWAAAEATGVTVTVGDGAAVKLQFTTRVATLTGSVRDAGGGIIAGVIVSAADYHLVGGAGRPPAIARSDDQGTYRLPLAPGSYLVLAHAAGYVPGREVVGVSAGVTRDFELTPAARIEGRARLGEQGEGAAGASVSLTPLGSRGTPRAMNADAEGDFAFDDVEPGEYRVEGRDVGRAGSLEPVAVASIQVRSDLDLVLLPHPSIKGQVLDGAGRPLAGAQLSLRR